MSDEYDWEEYVKIAQGILDDLPNLPEKAEDFAIKLEEKMTSMIEWMEEEEYVTEPMVDFINSKRDAVDEWLKPLGLA